MFRNKRVIEELSAEEPAGSILLQFSTTGVAIHQMLESLITNEECVHMLLWEIINSEHPGVGSYISTPQYRWVFGSRLGDVLPQTVLESDARRSALRG
jgi:hypothetical protein